MDNLRAKIVEWLHGLELKIQALADKIWDFWALQLRKVGAFFSKFF